MPILREKWPYVSPLFNIGGFMLENKVKDLIEEPINNMGIIIDSIEYVKEGNNKFFHLFFIHYNSPFSFEDISNI